MATAFRDGRRTLTAVCLVIVFTISASLRAQSSALGVTLTGQSMNSVGHPRSRAVRCFNHWVTAEGRRAIYKF
jgi:hypothetical protein